MPPANEVGGVAATGGCPGNGIAAGFGGICGNPGMFALFTVI